jgi:thioredoxin reductase (NADPH)
MIKAITVEIVIIGSGPAAYAAGIYTARAKRSHILLESCKPGGQLLTTTVVENYPGVANIDGPKLMGNMRDQAKDQGCQISSEEATSIEVFTNEKFHVETDDKQIYETRCIILATGATAKRLHLPQEEKFWMNGVSACATCDGCLPRFRNVPIAVIGGGDSAMEEATFLSKFGSVVYIIHRSTVFRASPVMLERVKKNPKIIFITDTIVEDVIGDEENGLSHILTSTKSSTSKSTSKLAVGGLFYAIGHTPNVDLIVNSKTLKDKVKMDEQKYILVKPGRTFTSVNGLFASGDVADSYYKQAGTAQGTGIMAAIDADRWL